jgi:UDPglucose 6-dehydrogenase
MSEVRSASETPNASAPSTFRWTKQRTSVSERFRAQAHFMDIAIIGSGYVGLVTGACFAEVGHSVICVDNDQRKVESLQNGVIPIYEPGLEEFVHRNVSANRLRFTTSTAEGVDHSQIIFIAVPTPPQPDGSVDLTYIEKVAREIAEVLKEYRVIVDKSTVPVKTGEKVTDTIRRYTKGAVEFDVVSNPEFLREGCAVADLMNPDRIVIGSNSDRALSLMKKVYEPFMAPIMVTDINSAELIKHAANSFLALKISYINAISAICEVTGADVERVADGIGADKRIGRSFLNAGLGYGGSCFPKDVAAFIAISDDLGVPFTLLKEVQRINQNQIDRFIKKIKDTLWVLKDKRIAVWGLTFKPDTDDVRNSVAIDLVAQLLREGAIVRAYDPKGAEKVAEFNLCKGAVLAKSALEAVENAEALVLATEWNEFQSIDFLQVRKNMHTPLVFDGRNLLDPGTMKELGFIYHGIGRGNAH